MSVKRFLILFLSLLIVACGGEVLPKPKAMLRLEYPEASFENFSSNCGYSFDKNTIAQVVAKNDCSFDLNYKKMKASIFLTYKPVNDNLNELLRDAQKLTYEHVVRADNIDSKMFVNDEDKVYGMFYKVTGNAASSRQFYATDSIHHFLTGSLYFYAKPNYDSIVPAADYLEKDIKRIMESLKWTD